jgi:hypothetical protein
MEDEEDKLHKRSIHGFPTYYADDAKDGANFLDYSLKYDEVKVFYQEAKARGAADFEDAHDRNFTVQYNSGQGNYTILRRKESSGWL